MLENSFRYLLDVATQTLLDTATSPRTGVYYWDDGSGNLYTSKKLLDYINSTGVYTVDADAIITTLQGLAVNQFILDIQQEFGIPQIPQLKFVEVTTDVSTTADEQTNETVTLFQEQIIPNEMGNKLEILFSASAMVDNNSDRVIVFHLFINNQFIRAARIFSDRGSSERSGSAALNYIYTIDSLDPLDVEIRWGHNGSGTARIQVSTEPEYSHASLIIKEVRV